MVFTSASRPSSLPNERPALLIAVLALVAPATARANPTELIGFGSHGPARGNAMVASDDALGAAIYNAAASPLGARRSIGAGWTYAIIDMDIDGEDPNNLDAHGAWLAMSVPFSITEDIRAGTSLALYLPDQFLARISALPATEPHLVLWDNRPHRIVVNAVAAVRFGDVLSIGAGLTFFADAGGKGVDLAIEALPGRTVADAEVDVELPMRRAPVVGLSGRRRPIPLRRPLHGEICSTSGSTCAITVVPARPRRRRAGLGEQRRLLHAPRASDRRGAGPWTFAAEIACSSGARSGRSPATSGRGLGIDILSTLFRTPSCATCGCRGRHRAPHRSPEDRGSPRRLLVRAQPDPRSDRPDLLRDADRHCATLGAAYSLAWGAPVTPRSRPGPVRAAPPDPQNRNLRPEGDYRRGIRRRRPERGWSCDAAPRARRAACCSARRLLRSADRDRSPMGRRHRALARAGADRAASGPHAGAARRLPATAESAARPGARRPRAARPPRAGREATICEPRTISSAATRRMRAGHRVGMPRRCSLRCEDDTDFPHRSPARARHRSRRAAPTAIASGERCLAGRCGVIPCAPDIPPGPGKRAPPAERGDRGTRRARRRGAR
jgi:hypothetical protein